MHDAKILILLSTQINTQQEGKGASVPTDPADDSKAEKPSDQASGADGGKGPPSFGCILEGLGSGMSNAPLGPPGGCSRCPFLEKRIKKLMVDRKTLYGDIVTLQAQTTAIQKESDERTAKWKNSKAIIFVRL